MLGGGPPLNHRVRAAIANSHLRHLPTELLTVLLRGAQRREAVAGRTLHHAGDRERHVELVVQGLIRVHASAPDGRTLTIRYCRPGGLMGILSLYAEPFFMPATTQAVVSDTCMATCPKNPKHQTSIVLTNGKVDASKLRYKDESGSDRADDEAKSTPQ
jgi:hypothetical protein